MPSGRVGPTDIGRLSAGALPMPDVADRPPVLAIGVGPVAPVRVPEAKRRQLLRIGRLAIRPGPLRAGMRNVSGGHFGVGCCDAVQTRAAPKKAAEKCVPNCSEAVQLPISGGRPWDRRVGPPRRRSVNVAHRRWQ